MEAPPLFGLSSEFPRSTRRAGTQKTLLLIDQPPGERQEFGCQKPAQHTSNFWAELLVSRSHIREHNPQNYSSKITEEQRNYFCIQVNIYIRLDAAFNIN